MQWLEVVWTALMVFCQKFLETFGLTLGVGVGLVLTLKLMQVLGLLS